MPSRFFDVIENYSNEEIINLISEVEAILDLEDNLICISKGKTMIIGDLHGDLETLHNIIQTFFREAYKTLIFLGDFVDRGVKQVEVVNVLFYYKKLLPDRVILIRGNHEDPIINSQYGFYDEIKLKFDNFKEMFRKYNQAFSRLPLAAITWNRIFCVHGGIPDGLENIEDINHLPKNQEEITCPITTQLVWNDPKENGKEFKKSSRGHGIKTFGKDVFNDFLERNTLKYVVRGHEKFKDGYRTYFDDKLISIFSSQAYSRKISTTVGVINEQGEIEIMPI
jgi:diadenosine tetraphosphatase ApaH/serine/threonine PP2A family protein phosphatase